MPFNSELLSKVRNAEMEIHCHEALIHQPAMKDGVELRGYGVIKITEQGRLYIDFICTSESERALSHDKIPEDSHDEQQTLCLSASALSRLSIESSGLCIRRTLQNMISGIPRMLRIYLEYIEVYDAFDEGYLSGNDFQLEYLGASYIPANCSNSYSYRDGSKEESWDQADIKNALFEFSHVDNKGHCRISCKNLVDASINDLRDSIWLYLSLASGSDVQIYYEFHEGNRPKSILRSHNKRKAVSQIGSALPYVMNGNSDEARHHYELLLKIYHFGRVNREGFESLSGYWSRVCNSFLAPDFSVSMLTLAVSIEGLINDLFLEKIAAKNRDSKFEEKKLEITEAVRRSLNIDHVHIDTICKQVSNWGRINTKSALSYLESNGVIDSLHVKKWSDLRNSSAHPSSVTFSAGREEKNTVRTIVCIGLMYRIILFLLQYKGEFFQLIPPNNRERITFDDQVFSILAETDSSKC